jgi:Mrp family chromosome partitioning ATPase
VGVGIFVFSRLHTKAPLRYRSTSSLQVAAPQQASNKNKNKSSSKNGATTTTVPDILVTGPRKIATQKTVEQTALRNAGVPEGTRLGMRAKFNADRGTLDLVVTAPTATVARKVAGTWATATVNQRARDVAKTSEQQQATLDKSVTKLHDELRMVDLKLQKLMPIVYGGILRFDAPTGNNPAPGRKGGGGSGPPPVPEFGPTASGTRVSDYALKISYERIALEQEISDRATKLSSLRINNVKAQGGFRLVSQTPATRVTTTKSTTLPALGGLFLGLLLALGAALLVDRADKTIRDPATAAAAFAAPVLSRIPVNGDGDFAVLAHPMSLTADAYRGLAATSIATDRLPSAMMVTTPHGDTHEPVAANYAAALARLGLKVALVATAPEQSWFMKPFSHPPDGSASLPELLRRAHDGTLNGHLQDRLATSDKAPNLVVVPPAQQPTLQLPVDGLPPLLHALSDSGIDVTVISGPALLEHADATIVAWATRNVLWAIEPGEITQVQARAAAARLELAGVTPFGVVMVERRHSVV